MSCDVLSESSLYLYFSPCVCVSTNACIEQKQERMHNNITHMRQSVSGASTHRASAHHARPSVSGASTHRLNASSESADGWPPLHFSGVGSPPLPQDPALHGFSLSPNMGQSLCQEKVIPILSFPFSCNFSLHEEETMYAAS